MSELQKEIFNIIITLDNDSLLSMKPLLEKLLDIELLKIDPNANLKEMDVYDKIDVIKATQILNNNQKSISYEDALKALGLEDDNIWNTQLNLNPKL